MQKNHNAVAWAKAYIQAKGEGRPYSLINPAKLRSTYPSAEADDSVVIGSIHPLTFFGQSLNHLNHQHPEDRHH